MTYELGVDLGTTYTAAAVFRDGQVEIATLGDRAASVPSVVFLKEDETVLTGDAANRRALTEPGRVAREFKRRVGDPTPIMLGGTPYSADALMSKMLRWAVDEVSTVEGGPPDKIAVTHPANWGDYKKDLLEQAVRQADVGDVVYLTEPEAAATYYASTERIEPGEVIAVYDLGGGTFDAAILRKTETGFDILGSPEGIERLGGIDIDEAVFDHVRRSLGEALEQLDPADPTATAAVARLRQDAIEAKEGLSSDTDVAIPVMLPNVQTEVRLTRAELEGMIRPTLTGTIEALRRALRSAGVEPQDVKAVLLVGGSSRIPLVAQMVSAELGRPVAVDAHPKHAIALGAALAAGSAVEREKKGAAAAAAAAAAAVIAPVPAEPTAAAAPTQPLTQGAPFIAPAAPGGAAAGIAPPGPPEETDQAARRRRILITTVVAIVLLALLGGGAWALFGRKSDDVIPIHTPTVAPTRTRPRPTETTQPPTTQPPTTQPPTTEPPTTEPPTTEPPTTEPPPESPPAEP